MDFRVLDEAIAFDSRGLALVIEDGDISVLCDGCRIRDARGKVHTVTQVTVQEDLTLLMIRDGDADYFGRLFRNVMLDGTLFSLLLEEM